MRHYLEVLSMPKKDKKEKLEKIVEEAKELEIEAEVVTKADGEILNQASNPFTPPRKRS